ncbi:MAG: flagellar motor stator protein MotA [Ignavibacteriales bacterium]|nr:flagellar motor stator protein MotA [Ignavibacteriales bacterium]
MFVYVGIAVVLVGVLGGFAAHGGPLGVLIQPSEFFIIGGATIGSLMISSPIRNLKQLVAAIGAVTRGDRYTKEVYVNTLKTMYEVFTIATRDGLINLEQHIEHPEKSAIFAKNEFLLQHHHGLAFFCDTIKLLLGGGVPPHDLEAMLEADIESHHAETATTPTMIQKIGDSLPGLGIVAAVLGIVVTMQAIDGPPAEIGNKVAAALVGTFIGVLASYGFVQPLATHIEVLNQSEARFFECIKAGVVAFSKGNAPIMVVEFSRRVIFSDVRPTFNELESAVRSSAKPAENQPPPESA